MAPLSSRLQRPGFGLPIDKLGAWDQEGEQRFPHAIADFFATDGITVREISMMDFMNQITDKPRWWEKINDGEVIARWRMEACGEDEELQRSSGKVLDATSFDYCLAELKDKAEYLREHGVVHVLDAKGTVVKSDVDADDVFWRSVREKVRTLEEVPDHSKDWHPGTDGLVLDLLHPSLFPLCYGISRVLPYGTVPLTKCWEYTGLGEVCSVPSGVRTNASFLKTAAWGEKIDLHPWGIHQWLPSEIRLCESGKARIDSYVNNLHPETHNDIYKLLESAVDKAIPLWNECLSRFDDRNRIELKVCGDDNAIMPMDLRDKPSVDADHAEKQEYWARLEAYEDRIADHPEERKFLHPSPSAPYVPVAKRTESGGQNRPDLCSDYPGGLQVIFKLASIQLTPEKPRYNGSSWHVEGALNEHICATALFYYDSENITDSFLEFREQIATEAMVMKPEQNEYPAAEALFGVKQDGPAIQQLGKVLTRPGRWLAFPNVLQHKVAGFALNDTTKPGHRKILAMFLVDPHISILSTANVPPQRLDWWAEEVRKMQPFAGLPVELFDRIIDAVDDFPIRWKEACEIREALMADRGTRNDDFITLTEEVSMLNHDISIRNRLELIKYTGDLFLLRTLIKKNTVYSKRTAPNKQSNLSLIIHALEASRHRNSVY